MFFSFSFLNLCLLSLEGLRFITFEDVNFYFASKLKSADLIRCKLPAKECKWNGYERGENITVTTVNVLLSVKPPEKNHKPKINS